MTLHIWGEPYTSEMAHAEALLVICQACAVRICVKCYPEYRELDTCSRSLVDEQ